MVEKTIYEILVGDVNIFNIVGTNVYPLVAPEGSDRPYITYQRISTPRVHHTMGYSGLASPRIQIDCYADSYDESKQLAEYARLALTAFKGRAASITICGILHEDDRDVFEVPFEGHDRPVKHVSMDFIVWYQDAVPLQPA